MPPPSPHTMILTCGPAPLNKLVRQIAEKNGYTEDMFFKF